MAHAKLNPSSAYRWSVCTAAPGLEAALPDTSSEAADWGTANHLLASTCLSEGKNPVDFLGQEVAFWVHPESDSQGESILDPMLEGAELDPCCEVRLRLPIDEQHVTCATIYVNRVRELAAGHTLLVEQRVPIDHITGEEGAGGTSDAVILADDELIVVDLKTGHNKVSSRHGDRMNLQLAMYASGALRKFEMLGDFSRVRAIIVQPTLSHESEHSLTVEELEAEIQILRTAANAEPQFVPGESQCSYCKAFPCAAATEHVVSVFGNLEAATAEPLGDLYKKLPLVRDWCDAIEARVRTTLEQGGKVPGWKLVEGKLGARKWVDPERAEKMLVEQFRLGSDAYDKVLISPATAEKLTTDKTIGPRQWKTLQTLIVQPRNRPSIAPESDKRPAFGMTADGLPDDVSDLL